jgi:hypothetical protein
MTWRDIHYQLESELSKTLGQVFARTKELSDNTPGLFPDVPSQADEAAVIVLACAEADLACGYYAKTGRWPDLMSRNTKSLCFQRLLIAVDFTSFICQPKVELTSAPPPLPLTKELVIEWLLNTYMTIAGMHRQWYRLQSNEDTDTTR